MGSWFGAMVGINSSDTLVCIITLSALSYHGEIITLAFYPTDLSKKTRFSDSLNKSFASLFVKVQLANILNFVGYMDLYQNHHQCKMR